ncbi:MAG: SDR family oxidoreductase [bacterium]
MKTLIFGATSAIATEFVQAQAARGAGSFFLVGRNAARLQAVADHFKVVKGLNIGLKAIHFDRQNEVAAAVEEARKFLSGLDVVLIANGSLPDQKKCEQDYGTAETEIMANFLSVISVLTIVANEFEKQKHGSIAVISSVAGDRGRQSNYIYGAAKGGLSVFLQGLRNRLAKVNVQVLTIKPGFVDTPMTAHLPKGILFAKPSRVAKGIVRAIEKGRDEVYLPCFWRWIMLIIRSIPECVFKKLRL